MLSCVLQYSTIDFKFLEHNLKQISICANDIIVPICQKLYNGENENLSLLEKSYEICKKYNATIVPFEWNSEIKNTRYYHNLSRKLGTDKCKNEWIIFLDTDEIVSNEFGEWFDTIKNSNYGGFWLTCYWYFRNEKYRAKSLESAGLLVKKEYCNWNLYSNERQQLFGNILNFVNGDYSKILSKSGEPLVHHFSWVRSKEEMLLKVKNWGHNNDYGRNWEDLVNEEFSREFNGTDFVHDYQYDIVKPEFTF